MAFNTPFPMVVNPQVQPHNTGTKTERTNSEENSKILDAFLKSRTATAPTYLEPAKAVSSNAFNSAVLTLPLEIIKRIMRILLISPNPLILHHDSVTRSQGYRTYIEANTLQVSKVFHNVGIPILYGENTLTTSSPATSSRFDEHLLSLPGSKRQLITSVKLEIGWADELWAKFPLVARALGELKALLKLEIIIVEKQKPKQKKRTALLEKDVNLKINITYNQSTRGKNKGIRQPASLTNKAHSPGKNKTVRQQASTDRVYGRVKREGEVAQAMLKAEMKMFKDLVDEIKGLKEVRLLGFKNMPFAWSLEEYVRLGKCYY